MPLPRAMIPLPQVAMFQRVEGGAGGSGTSSSSGRPDAWVYTHYKRPHTHDVRALAAVALGGDKGSILVSGGVDAQLLAYRSRAFLQVGSRQQASRRCCDPTRLAVMAVRRGDAPVATCWRPGAGGRAAGVFSAMVGDQSGANAPPRNSKRLV